MLNPSKLSLPSALLSPVPRGVVPPGRPQPVVIGGCPYVVVVVPGIGAGHRDFTMSVKDKEGSFDFSWFRGCGMTGAAYRKQVGGRIWA